ncbi:type II toxin-antitoxin system PemK/MazF family toxin [Pseudonocardia sp. TRM90224]|uniref:type II toxin-antitoxin system PemK/MazF family toxin n=1 Tax=Pseudonocardia sp. TRM90224 TaxID=2812678 RepID=UPI001E655E94|nr:type II toxin-antitoxin system PemK/MazF family toxin [Pseudonocardia sp. TRM90224]
MSTAAYPARGEIWRYNPVIVRENRSDLRLIVSTDAVNAANVPTLVAVHVVAQQTESLLSVTIEPYGWAVAGTLEQVMRRRLTERVTVVPAETMEQVDVALRAYLEL